MELHLGVMRGVACHDMGSHSVTCHPTLVTTTICCKTNLR